MESVAEQTTNIMNIFGAVKDISKMSQEEVLRHLSVFNCLEVSALISSADSKTIDGIIKEASSVLTEAAKNIPKGQLYWSENTKKIAEKVKEKFPEVFQSIIPIVNDMHLKSKFEYELNFAEGRIKESVSALISTPEEAAKIKDEITIKLNEFQEKINQSDIKSSDIIQDLKCQLMKAKENAFKYVDEKLAEEPVKVYFYKTGNRVSCKVKLNKNGFKYTVGRGKEFRTNRGTDSEEYDLIVAVSYIDDFLYNNGIRDEDILVDSRSVDEYYSYDGHISVNLTPAFVKEWWNLDCPDIYRCTPNKDRSVNMLGMPIVCFSNKLVESAFSTDYIDKTITEEEVNLLTKGYEDTRIYKEMKSVLEARTIENNENKVQQIKDEIKAFDDKIQSSIDIHKDEILEYLKNEFKTRVASDNPLKINDDFGLDCGFLFVLTTDTEYTKKRSLLRNLIPSESTYMNVRMPYDSQSTTLMRTEFQKVKEIVERETGISLYADVSLD